VKLNQSEIPSTRKRIVVLTGDQPRHHFFTKNLDTHTDLVGVVTEKKTTQEDNPVEKSNFLQNHQKNLLKYEIKCMGDRVPHFSNSIECEPGKINDKDILNWVLDLEPDYIALFGTSILNRDWIKNFQNKIINLHLGSSPRYRGSATLFWPFFNN
jgi:methionyl-tRNA formyltransferase